MSKTSNLLKSLWEHIKEADGIWSIPLSIIGFLVATNVVQWFYGGAVGTYDPAIYTAALLSISVNMVFFGFTTACLWFNQTGIYNYFFKGKRLKTQFLNDITQLDQWQRTKLNLSIFGFIFLSLLVVFYKLV